MKAITVLLCDDHTAIREGLRLLVEEAEDIDVVGEAENGREAVQEAKRLLPDIVLLDLSMPLLEGVEATRQIAREVPSAKVLILSGYTDDQHVQHAFEAGAAGYLTKGTCTNGLLQAVREIARGTALVSPAVAPCFVRQRPELCIALSPGIARASTLTRRQREVLRLIAGGFANKQMADVLSVSIKTVEKHRQTLMNKLSIHTTATLTSYAVSMGIVEPTLRHNWSSDISSADRRREERRACAMRWQSN